MSTGHLLRIEGLAVRFRTGRCYTDVVHDISLHLDRGETLAIVGESGSGKSVTAQAVMAILDTPPAEVRRGRIVFEGQDLLALDPVARRKLNGERIAMIFQDTLAHLNPVHTIGTQIGETLRAHRGQSGASAQARAIELLGRVGIPRPEQRIDDYPHQLSGGQRQRVMIAMALALEPALLVADEPTTALDVTIQAQILDLLRELRDARGLGLLLITHDLGVVADIADRVAVMHRGAIVETGPVREVMRSPAHDYTRRLLAASPEHLESRRSRARPVESEPAILAGLALHREYPARRNLLGQSVGEAVRAVEGVSLEVRRGETVGIVGESGSGKSTLARLLLGLEPPTTGRVLYRGRDLASLEPSERKAFRRQVQVVFQDPFASLDPRMTIQAIIAEPWTIHKDVVPRRRWPERVTQLLRQVGLLPEHAGRYPHQFSGGQRQRIAIARALALEPALVICDEAVSALDVQIQAQILELLASLQDQLGLAYLFIAHDLPIVRLIADRVLVMSQGRVVEAGLTEAIFAAPKHPYTRALLAASPVTDPDEQRARREARRTAMAAAAHHTA